MKMREIEFALDGYRVKRWDVLAYDPEKYPGESPAVMLADLKQYTIEIPAGWIGGDARRQRIYAAQELRKAANGWEVFPAPTGVEGGQEVEGEE